jgi:hypothetical protein
LGGNYLRGKTVDFKSEEEVKMGLFRNKGPSELNNFGPGDALMAAAGQIYGMDFSEGTVLYWLQGPANGAEGLFEANATIEQKAGLTLWTSRVIESFDNLTKGQILPGTQKLLASHIQSFAAEAITGSEKRPNGHSLETPLSIVTASAALRMAQLKRKNQAHEILKDGMMQVGSLILANDYMF